MIAPKQIRNTRLVTITVLGMVFLYPILYLSTTNVHPLDLQFQIRKQSVKDICQRYSKEARESTADKLYNFLNRTNPKKKLTEFGDFLSEYQMQHMLIDPRHKILFCYVPKVGCSNWKRIFLMLTGRSHAKDPLDIKATRAHTEPFLTLKDLPVKDRAEVLEEYTKLLFVRHPLERILSAFRNKFEGTAATSIQFQKSYGRQIINRFRKKVDGRLINSLDGVTFEEFIKYLMEPAASLQFNHWQSYQEHWEPINGLCNPCSVNYDFIGLFENLVEESNIILKKFSKGIQYPETSRVETASTTNHMTSYYLPLAPEQIKGLEKVFAMDFLLFNYTLKGNE